VRHPIVVYTYLAVVLMAFVLAIVLPAPYWRWALRVTYLGMLGPAVFRFLV
jgi:hypothetical protein